MEGDKYQSRANYEVRSTLYITSYVRIDAGRGLDAPPLTCSKPPTLEISG